MHIRIRLITSFVQFKRVPSTGPSKIRPQNDAVDTTHNTPVRTRTSSSEQHAAANFSSSRAFKHIVLLVIVLYPTHTFRVMSRLQRATCSQTKSATTPFQREKMATTACSIVAHLAIRQRGLSSCVVDARTNSAASREEPCVHRSVVVCAARQQVGTVAQDRRFNK